MKSPGRALVGSVLVATAGLAMAQDRPPSPSAQGQPSVSASKPSLRHFLTGTLVGFDVEKGTVTFKDESGKKLTWPVEVRLAEYARAYAQMRLQTLKEGDLVNVLYVVDAAGERRVYDVKPARRGAGGQRRDGEARPAGAPTSPTSPAPPQ
jgi:Cu/Ag efflux protein CusF